MALSLKSVIWDSDQRPSDHVHSRPSPREAFAFLTIFSKFRSGFEARALPRALI